jgi:HPt (histidine-containing phosphotransfer) domain-containing protein
MPKTGSLMTDPLAELRSRFVARTKDRVAALRVAIEREPNNEEATSMIASLAHQIAGAAGTFGYAALGRAAAALEDAADNRDRSSAAARCEVLHARFSAVEASVAALDEASAQ